MDCSPLFWNFSNLSESCYYKFYKDNATTFYKLNLDINYQKEKQTGFEQIKALFFRKISEKSGIISLTTNPLNTLMWAHYATEKGFAIELDWPKMKSNLNKGKNNHIQDYVFFPVQYVSDLKPIDSFQKNFNSQDVPFLYSTAVKRKDWEYENEWRLITFSDGYAPNDVRGIRFSNNNIERKIHYPLDAIKSITLGKNFFSNVKRIDDEKFEISYSCCYKDKSEKNLVDFIFNNLNDKLYWCGEYKEGEAFKRSSEKISLKKISADTFEIERKNDGFRQD
ncbi:MAG: DUF2971 domain-containing protein [Paludibacteraceae bacterium]|nr:DUF2971 domain-containing protein [Paludibacteraceae bacterium]